MTVRNAASLRRDRMRSEQESHESKAAPVSAPAGFPPGPSSPTRAAAPAVAVKQKSRTLFQSPAVLATMRSI
jgi:hypothetical protein